MLTCNIKEDEKIKTVHSSNYNMIFNKENGTKIRWGKEKEDNPVYSPYGPETLSIEICRGGDCIGCPQCYKRNGRRGDPTKNISLEEFKEILKIMPKSLLEINLGIMMVGTNPDLFNMIDYSESIGYPTSFTYNGIITDDQIEIAANKTTAISCSIYPHLKQKAYDSLEKLGKNKRGYRKENKLRQILMHVLISDESQAFAREVINDMVTDPRLTNVDGLLLLQQKPKGDYIAKAISDIDYQNLLQLAISNKIKVGTDTCSSGVSCRLWRKNDIYPLISRFCDGLLFSAYIDMHRHMFPCSFSEDLVDFLDLSECKTTEDFLAVWNNETAHNWRNMLLNNCSNCSNCEEQEEMRKECHKCPIFQLT
jgi:hypothetical protein